MKRYLLALLLFIPAFAPLNALGQTGLVYQVSMRGTVNTYNVPFQRSGNLVLTSTISNTGTTNGVNPIDAALISGNPLGSPSTGAIWYFTNMALYKLAGSG